MKRFTDIKSLIDTWPTIAAFADDLGCGYEAARKMRTRNRVSPDHWATLVSLCKKTGRKGVTIEWLAKTRSAQSEVA